MDPPMLYYDGKGTIYSLDMFSATVNPIDKFSHLYQPKFGKFWDNGRQYVAGWSVGAGVFKLAFDNGALQLRSSKFSRVPTHIHMSYITSWKYDASINAVYAYDYGESWLHVVTEKDFGTFSISEGERTSANITQMSNGEIVLVAGALRGQGVDKLREYAPSMRLATYPREKRIRSAFLTCPLDNHTILTHSHEDGFFIWDVNGAGRVQIVDNPIITKDDSVRYLHAYTDNIYGFTYGTCEDANNIDHECVVHCVIMDRRVALSAVSCVRAYDKMLPAKCSRGDKGIYMN